MKIYILGGPGAGKTYAARLLTQRFSVTHIELDELYWDNDAGVYGTMTPPFVRDEKLTHAMSTDEWIAEGVYYDWPINNIEKADVVCVLKVNKYKRLWRILIRIAKRKVGIIKSKHERLRDIIWLLSLNQEYDQTHLPKALEMFTLKGKTVHLYQNADALIAHFSRICENERESTQTENRTKKTTKRNNRIQSTSLLHRA